MRGGSRPAKVRGVAETATTARRWNSFVCPGCRFIFRVPRDHDGKGVVCPGCKVMLRLPGAEDEPGPLLAPRREAPDTAADEAEHEEAGPTGEGEGDGTLRLIAMMAVPGLLLLGLFAWMMMPDKDAPAAAAAVPGESAPAAEEEAEPAAEEAPPAPRAPSEMVQMEETARKFMEAPTQEEALALCFRPEAIREKAAEWYAREPYEAPGFQGTTDNLAETAVGKLRITSLGVRTGDFDPRHIALVQTPEGFRVDWESWVGWSEMSWEDFKAQRPAEPKRFRAISSASDYYNFGFKDETEWISFRLESPDGMHFLYGYAPAGSDLAARLRPLDGVEKRPVILELSYPPDGKADNQVIIGGISGDGWIDLPEQP